VEELWKSDGTAAGTLLVRDIYPGGVSSDPRDLVAMDNKLYFSADDGVHGRELWQPPSRIISWLTSPTTAPRAWTWARPA
jgi:ELWxxDGT repeat protein